jgi:hypothetical protein
MSEFGGIRKPYSTGSLCEIDNFNHDLFLVVLCIPNILRSKTKDIVRDRTFLIHL